MEKPKEGNIVKIKNFSYEVIFTREEAEPAPDQDPPIRRFFGVYLHKLISKSLKPTHLIKYYDDDKNVFLELQKNNIIAEDIEVNK